LIGTTVDEVSSRAATIRSGLLEMAWLKLVTAVPGSIVVRSTTFTPWAVSLGTNTPLK